jgi:hypothetical protein
MLASDRIRRYLLSRMNECDDTSYDVSEESCEVNVFSRKEVV